MKILDDSTVMGSDPAAQSAFVDVVTEKIQPRCLNSILVPTPIGNLGDITIRAVEVLGSAGVILAEDTRTTRILA